MVNCMKNQDYFDSNYFLPMLQFIHSSIDRDSAANLNYPYVQEMKFFSFTPLFFLCHVHPLVFLKYMACRTVSKPGSSLSSFKETNMKTSFQFYVGFIDGPFGQTLEDSLEVNNTKKRLLGLITKLFQNQFDFFQTDELTSFEESFHQGNTFFLFGTDMKGGSAFHIIGCVMFSADHSGIWVNWIGISKTKYDSIRFQAGCL